MAQALQIPSEMTNRRDGDVRLRHFAIAVVSLLSFASLSSVSAGCPYSRRSLSSVRPDDDIHRHLNDLNFKKIDMPSVASGSAVERRSLVTAEIETKAAELNWTSVKADIEVFLTDSQDFWPADFGNYGPFMIRQAWHCSGTYRAWDGRGGCDGVRQRFEPELSWPDNTNLDKPKKLLQPIKLKYGDALSWGDLIVLTGTIAIQSMGGPVLGFCGGRTDDVDGSASVLLGPTAEQEAFSPCTEEGNCQSPLGASVIGLIYVDPKGFMGNPVPEQSAPEIRNVFARMGMDDYETVALIGGGHAFGKFHGACTTGPGPSPREDPANPYPGTCGSGPDIGKGLNTFTSGLEGQWTNTPTVWTNEYFDTLLTWDFNLTYSPAGDPQWLPILKPNSTLPALHPEVRMMTTDVALVRDAAYLPIVQLFADNMPALEDAFARAWYKLVTRDSGPVTRCIDIKVPGLTLPPAEPWQYPLPAPLPTCQLPNFKKVAKKIAKAIAHHSSAMEPDYATPNSTTPYYGALFASLAYQCAGTFRETDHFGGCNGARIRFEPQKSMPSNVGMDMVLEVLTRVKAKFGDSLSWADLIVLAGSVAITEAGAGDVPFCGGRVDALDGDGGPPIIDYFNTSEYIKIALNHMDVMGLTPEEFVALQARMRSPTQQALLGYSGSWTNETGTLSNAYFTTLLLNDWTMSTSAAGMLEFVCNSTQPVLYMTPADLAVKYSPVLLSVAQRYASEKELFLMEFRLAWTKIMNADRFKGPTGSVCA